MEFFKKISSALTNPKDFMFRLNKYLNWIFIDKIIFFFAIFIFTFFPNYIYLFLGELIIKKSDKWKKGDPEDDWIFSEEPSVVFDEINIICRGSSLKKNIGKINKNFITFFVNIDKKFLDTFSELKKIPYIGITADKSVEKQILLSGLTPVINLIGGYKINGAIAWDRADETFKNNFEKNKKILNKINLIKSKKITHFKERNEIERFYIGSAVLAIFFLGKHSRKVNIYGWDHYLDRNVDEYNYFQSLYNMAFRSKGPWDKKLKFVFAEAIWNWQYAFRITNDNKYKIFSNLSTISVHKKILKKINTIFFN